LPWITAIGLLTSCAMLAVSCPTAASFSLRTRWACASSSARVRSATLASSSAFQRCSSRVLSAMVEQLVQVRGQAADLVAAGHVPTRASSAPASTRCMVAAICSSGRKMARAQRSDTQAAAIITAKKTAPMPASTPYFTRVNGASR
jgi:hypothetical protein